MWDAEGAKIRADLGAMARMLTSRGLRAADLVCSPDVADTIIENAEIKDLLNNRRYELGNVAPEELAPGASVVARLNVNGRIISVISYDETYTLSLLHISVLMKAVKKLSTTAAVSSLSV